MKRYLLLLGIIAVLLLSCKPAQVDPVSPLVKPPAPAPVPEPIAGNQVEVTIRHTFNPPENLVVDVGQEVIWINGFSEGFKIVGELPSPYASDFLAPGQYFIHVYEEPGTFEYILVPGKKGNITVRG